MNDQENPSVRETALTALGTIGAPAIVQVQDAIYKALSDVDSNVRTAAVWCIGKFGGDSGFSEYVHPKIVK